MIQKSHKNFNLHCKQTTHLVQFGNFAIKNKDFILLKENQILALHWIINQFLKTQSLKYKYKVWDLTNLNKNLTKLSLESRMGKGKGNFYSKAVFLKPGKIMFEFDNVNYSCLLKLLKLLNKRFSGNLILIARF